MSIKVQEAPQAPSYAAANIQVPASIATPQATMENLKAQQSELISVNTLSGGRRKKHTAKRGKKSREYKHRSFIRTYKGRRYQKQQGGTNERIPIPQVGSTCNVGAQCGGVQNASFTALHNQAQSNSINDSYVAQGGGGKRKTFRASQRHHHRRRHHSQSLSSMIAYNIKKVMRKVFS
jgi:hypothetical protein